MPLYMAEREKTMSNEIINEIYEQFNSRPDKFSDRWIIDLLMKSGEVSAEIKRNLDENTALMHALIGLIDSFKEELACLSVTTS